MATKVLNTKIALLYKSYSEWQSNLDYVPLKGEVCICEVPLSTGQFVEEPCVLFKVGDGSKTFGQLPWASAMAADVYAWAKDANLDFDKLDTTFRDKLVEFIEEHISVVDTKYQIVDDGKDKWKLQKDEGSGWVDATGYIDISNKVDKELLGTNGKAIIFNEVDGGGAKFEHNDGTESFIGVNDGGEDGIAAQIYADKLIGGKWTGAKLDVTNQGIYYTVGDKSVAERDVAANELATKKDIAAITIPEYTLTKEVDPGEYAAIYHLTKDGVAVGEAINIAKDQMLKSVEVNTCTQKDVPIAGLEVGDKYLDFTFLVEAGEEVHRYIAIKDMVKPYTAGEGIVITSENAIAVDTEVIATVEYVDASISDTMNYIMLEDAAERAARIAGDELIQADLAAEVARATAEEAKKVDKTIVGTRGQARIFNESDGGGSQFMGKDGVVAYVGTHDNIGGEIGTLIYVDRANGTESTIIDVTQNGAYYTKGTIIPGSQRDVEANEIATKGNIAELDSELATIAKTGNVNDLILDSADILVLNCNI